MVDQQEVKRRVKKAIVDALGLQIDPHAIPDDEVIFGGGMGADSTAALEVVFEIEEAFGIEVDDEELRVDLFDSVSSLTNYVQRRLDVDDRNVPNVNAPKPR
ncbi:MAG: acyl carrier protein [Gemmatimonadota bacterium]|nr:acyl carrier protein [Gemmatimonadota bacterium]